MLKVIEFNELSIVEVIDSPVVLAASVRAEVDRLWLAEQNRRAGHLTDGTILSALEVNLQGIVGRVVEYRYFIAQNANPELFGELQVRPVAVSGLLECPDGILFGRRAASLTQDRGFWELCPSGGLDASDIGTGVVEYRAQILAELQQEIGIDAKHVSKLNPLCLVENSETHVIDIAIGLRSQLSGKQLHAMHQEHASREYDEILLVRSADIATFIAQNRQRLVDVSIVLLERWAGLSSHLSPQQ